jgi:hypothetical protein
MSIFHNQKLAIFIKYLPTEITFFCKLYSRHNLLQPVFHFVYIYIYWFPEVIFSCLIYLVLLNLSSMNDKWIQFSTNNLYNKLGTACGKSKTGWSRLWRETNLQKKVMFYIKTEKFTGLNKVLLVLGQRTSFEDCELIKINCCMYSCHRLK